LTISLDNEIATNSTSFSFAHMPNVLVILGVYDNGQCTGHSPVTSVSIGSDSMTKLLDCNVFGHCQLWYAFRSGAAPSGETITLTGGAFINVVVISLTGTVQSEPFFEDSGTNGCSGCGSCSVSVPAGTVGRWVIGVNGAVAIATGGMTIYPASGFSESEQIGNTCYQSGHPYGGACEIECQATSGAVSAGCSTDRGTDGDIMCCAGAVLPLPTPTPLAATCTIVGLGADIELQIIENAPSESDSPPPSAIDGQQKRALVIHEIPTREGDRGQDMGAYSRTIKVTGIGLSDVKDALDTLATLPQLDSDGYGYLTVTLKDSSGTTLESYGGLALGTYSRTPRKGTRKWWNYVIDLTQFTTSAGIGGAGMKFARIPYTGDGADTHLIECTFVPRIVMIAPATPDESHWGSFFGISDQDVIDMTVHFSDYSSCDRWAIVVLSGTQLDVGNVTGLGSVENVNTSALDYVMYAYG
jgi:hypothetical protein